MAYKTGDLLYANAKPKYVGQVRYVRAWSYSPDTHVVSYRKEVGNGQKDRTLILVTSNQIKPFVGDNEDYISHLKLFDSIYKE